MPLDFLFVFVSWFPWVFFCIYVGSFVKRSFLIRNVFLFHSFITSKLMLKAEILKEKWEQCFLVQNVCTCAWVSCVLQLWTARRSHTWSKIELVQVCSDDGSLSSPLCQVSDWALCYLCRLEKDLWISGTASVSFSWPKSDLTLNYSEFVIWIDAQIHAIYVSR